MTLVGLDPARPITIGADSLALGWSCDAPRVATPTYTLAPGDFERLAALFGFPLGPWEVDGRAQKTAPTNRGTS